MSQDIRQILGLTGYYQKLIPGYADLVQTLIKLTHKTFFHMDRSMS